MGTKAIYRLLYILFVKRSDMTVVDDVLKALKIKNDTIAKCISYQYPEPDKDHNFSYYAPKYQESFITKVLRSWNVPRTKKLLQIIGDNNPELIKQISVIDKHRVNVLEYAMWAAYTSFYQYMLTLAPIKAMYDPNNDDINIQQNVYRVIYVIFCKSNEYNHMHFDTVLTALGLTGEVIAKYFKFDYPKRDMSKKWDYTIATYDEDEIISRIVLRSSYRQKYLTKLCSLVEEKEFVRGVFVSDSKSNRNALEHAIHKQLLSMVEYFMSLKGIKIEMVTNDELLWRCIYWLNEKYDKSIAVHLIKELDLNEDKLKKLKNFKCQTSDNEAFKYSDKTISDEAIDKLLKLKNEI